jgi:hypothetical protein
MWRSGNSPPTAFATAERLFGPTQTYCFVIPGWSAGPDPESRDSGFALRAPRNDHHAAQICLARQIFVTSIRPDNSDRIPLRPSPPGMGTLVIRFVGLLVVAVVVLALAWSR